MPRLSKSQIYSIYNAGEAARAAGQPWGAAEARAAAGIGGDTVETGPNPVGFVSNLISGFMPGEAYPQSPIRGAGGILTEAIRGLFTGEEPGTLPVGGDPQQTGPPLVPADPLGPDFLAQMLGYDARPYCWQNNRYAKSRSVQIRRVPNPGAPGGFSLIPVFTCRRKMNPLNPKALARAGRRVGAFTSIAKGMMKMLEKSCAQGAKRKTRVSYGSCRTRKRC